MEYDQKEKEAEILSEERLRVIIPECCREGWASCPHVPKKQRKSRTNIGL